MVVHAHSTLEFQRIVLEGSRKQLVVVDFYADWCGPCRMVAPVFESLEHKYAHVLFVKVNVDEAQEVAQQCSVRAMPTFQLFQNGCKVDEIVGANVSALERSITVFGKPPAFSGSGYTLGTKTADDGDSAQIATGSGKVDSVPLPVDNDITAASLTDKPVEIVRPSSSDPEHASPQLVHVRKSFLDELESMGFPRNRAIKACIATRNESLQAAMDWIFAHDEEANVDDIDPNLQFEVTEAEASNSKETQEEKERLAKQLREEVRKRREDEEKRLAAEQEKNRLRSGKEIAEAKRRLEEEQRKRDMQERFREKREKQLERERLRKLLAEDRQRRLEMQRNPTAVNPPEEKQRVCTETTTSSQTATCKVKVTRLQLRLPDGSNLEADFTNETLLREVANYVLQQRPGLGDRITLMNAYPRRKFQEHEMDQLTLRDAQLHPRGALFILRS
ncbi:hypothetical protein F1559_004289 [Cyanidiococcus yangmingshanensis]|uniref:Uncharacterized protein n=1 Tax=Cyanidiococcus yangmingshanensis TaxID=2690220 RepID=A0A7J7IJ38_9RHOD|nr:hypothetical protein F1559_004289 [Cyanidiococcus yangmingshanensis]